MKETILLTGATGFLGSHLLELLISNKNKVVILKRLTSNTTRIDHLLSNVVSYNIDETDIEDVFKEESISSIIHTACTYGRNKESLAEIVNNNVKFGLKLLEEGIKYNVKTFINTDSLLPKNVNSYSLSKSQFYEWLKMNSGNIQVINLKIEHMYGPKDDKNKFIYWLINEMIHGTNTIDLTSGTQKRDFIYIEDVVSAFNLVLKKKSELSSLNEFDVGTGNFCEVKKFVLLIAERLEKKYNKEIISRLNFGAISYRQSDIMTPDLDNSKLINLGWKYCFGIEEGIRKIIKE